MLPFIVIGLTSGAVYSLAGLGLVLTYKTSGVFNFAHGALATVAAYVFYVLYVLNHWAWPLAAAVAILVVGPAMGLVFELLARRIQTASLALRVASTVGVLLVVEAGVELIYGTETVRIVPTFLGSGEFKVFGTLVQVSQLVTLLFAIVVTVVLTGFFRYSRRGIAMRAVVDNPELLDVSGTNPVATRRVAWMVGVSLAAASGVLFAPVLSLDPVQLTLLVVSAFGAAALGAFTSLPVTLLGGLGIGVLASLCTKWFTTGLLSGLPPSMPFVVLFVVILVFPRRRLIARSFTVSVPRPARPAPALLQLPVAAGLLIFLALVPNFVGIHLTDWTTFVAMTIVFLSLSLLVQTSGQVSLAHVSFVAIGAASFSHFAVGSHIPWLPALLLAGLVAVPVGALLAIPAIRLTGLYLALATFGFGILLQGMFYSENFMFGSNGNGLSEPGPHLSFWNVSAGEGYYYLVLIVAVAAAAFVVLLIRSRLGRLLRGAADSQTALQTAGTSIQVTRVMVFCIAAFMAAIGGALAAVGQSTVSADSYQPILSLTYFAIIIVVGGATPWNAILASAALFIVPSYVSGAQVTTVLQLVFGAAAIAVSILPRQHGVLGVTVTAAWARFSQRLSWSPGHRQSPPPATVPETVAAGVELGVSGLRVCFGGLVAVDGVELTAPAGQITGLIGPNGAGKTTTFNACTGLVRPTEGSITLAGRDVSRRGSAARARLGLGRTFQRMELFESLTVRENVEAGAEASMAGANPFTQVVSLPGQRAQIVARATQAMESCGIADLAERPAAALSTGQRRLVELARCLAGPFGVLLLDEPSSGLDRTETERFGQILREVVAQRGVAILLVEHDMELVNEVCDRVYVLDFGKLVFAGTPAEAAASSVVQAAYLGSPEVETAAVEPGSRAVSDALELRSITAGYGQTTVLRDVSVEVPAGSVVALLGPNGAGKTTLLRVAAGLMSPGRGDVRISGTSVTTLAANRRTAAGMCLIPEGRGIFPNLSVRENLILQIPASARSRDIDAAVEAFPVLGERLGQSAGSMSGGQQQMLALSRCFLGDPKVVLLDEVSMGLAPKIIDEIFTAIARLRQRGVSLLLVEQYVSRALAVADRVYLLAQGQVRFSGPPSGLDSAAIARGYLGG